MGESLARRNQSTIALWPAQLVPYPPFSEIHCGAVDLMGEPAFPYSPINRLVRPLDAVTRLVVPSWDP